MSGLYHRHQDNKKPAISGLNHRGILHSLFLFHHLQTV
nr:MAG TPA: hypothetical protein [Bacteriophage sp.]